MSAVSDETERDAAIAGWAAALRSGETTPWSQWREQPRPAAPAVSSGAVGAAQLELVRRLASRGVGPGFAEMADLVLATPAGGRGRVDIPLPWHGTPPAYGTPPIEPEELPAAELLRVAVAVLARTAPSAVAPPDQSAGRWWSRRFRVYGAPMSAVRTRGRLRAAGLLPGDFRAVHLVLTGPLERVVREQWTVQATRGRGRSWPRVWRGLEARGSLPPSLDPIHIVERIRETVPTSRVHVLVADTPDHAAELAAEVLGLNSDQGLFGSGPTGDRLPAPVLVDLARRVDLATWGRVSETGGPPALSWLPSRCGQVVDSDLGAPARYHSWLAGTAADLVSGLDRVDCAVHGDRSAITESVAGPRWIPEDGVLDLALRALARTGDDQ